MYFFVVLFGYVGTTIYYSNGNCCMSCNLFAPYGCNCTSYAGIVSLMYNNIPPLLPILSFLNIAYHSSPNSASVISLFAHARLFILGETPALHGLIRHCTLIHFRKFGRFLFGSLSIMWIYMQAYTTFFRTRHASKRPSG